MAAGSKKWYRIGNADEYSEFTFNPRWAKDKNTYIPGNMSGSRGTGVATGQYAFGKPEPEPGSYEDREDQKSVRIPIEPAKNPLKIRGWLDPLDEVRDLQEAAISLMRFAEGAEEGYGGKSLMALKYKLMNYRPNDVPVERVEADVDAAIKDWQICKQVHPMNILLSRWGYDGIEYVGDAEKYGNSGTYGNVKFPPIDDAGCLLCMVAVNDRYMTLDEDCAKMIDDAKKKLCGMMRKATSDEQMAGGEYIEMAGLAGEQNKETLLGIAADEKRHREIILGLIAQACR